VARFALPTRLAVPGTAVRLAVRMTLAAVLTHFIAESLHLPQAFWAVVTALVVVQASLGGTLGAGIDRMIGTALGALVGAAVAVLRAKLAIPDILALAVALVPMAMAASIRPNFRMAPITAAIILLGSPPDLPPLEAALHRIGEIALGSFVGVAVSLLVFPARAHRLIAERVGETLAVLGEVVERHLLAAAAPADLAAIERLNDRSRRLLAAAEGAVAEAMRERRSRLTDAPPPEPLLRSVRRVRSDAAMVGRATVQPLPAPLARKVEPELRALAGAMRAFLTEAGRKLLRDEAPPSFLVVDAALERFMSAWPSVRLDLETAAADLDQAGRLLALPFAIETLRRDLGDLAAALATLRPTPGGAEPGA
jgi:uncharacterized membrane protein YccC